jgi:uncharacterized protein (TIGR02757 family)
VRDILDRLYETLNRREYVHPDPLELVHEYDRPDDRELVGLVASSLAYGRVSQILGSARAVLGRLGEHPARFVAGEPAAAILSSVSDIRHRFTVPEEIGDLLVGAGRVMQAHGSLEACFTSGMKTGDETTAPALGRFVDEIAAAAGTRPVSLLPLPDRGSACKRLHLFLRWMVRDDDVDPGVWSTVDRSMLVVPLDTHMHRIARRLGLTTRTQADFRTALDVTRAFREFAPDDPVRYDFALTRIGIRPDCSDMLDARCAPA